MSPILNINIYIVVVFVYYYYFIYGFILFFGWIYDCINKYLISSMIKNTLKLQYADI